ncbi:MAG: condensation domain-containing protein, partial [Duganella sp.]
MNKPLTDLHQLQQAILMQRLQKRVRQAASQARSQPQIALADRQQPLALSHAQQRLWFLTELDQAASIAYHIPAQLRLSGRLDVAAFKATLNRIVARHESLRTRFVKVDGVPVQQIDAADVGLALTQTDLSDLPAGQHASAVQRLSDDEAIRPFDLANDAPIRGQLLRLGAEEHVLLLTQHHIVSDGWSIGVLVRELSALYGALVQQQPDPLPPLAIQYADYAAWQRQWLQSEVPQTQAGWWQQQLAGAPALLELPTDRVRPARQSYAGGSVPLLLDTTLTAALKALAQRHGATLFMTLLAGWATLLARLAGQDDVVIGTPVANRQRPEVEGLIGFFVNTLALRVRFERDPTVAELLAQVKSATLGAHDRQDLPFEQVVEALQPARSMSHSPLFQVLFSLDNAPAGGALQLPGLSIDSVQPTHNTAQFDLTLSLADSNGELSGSLRYASDLFDRASIERIGGHFTTLLRALVADDHARVASLPLLSPDQRQALLHDFNAAPAPATAAEEQGALL